MARLNAKKFQQQNRCPHGQVGAVARNTGMCTFYPDTFFANLLDRDIIAQGDCLHVGGQLMKPVGAFLLDPQTKVDLGRGLLEKRSLHEGAPLFSRFGQG